MWARAADYATRLYEQDVPWVLVCPSHLSFAAYPCDLDEVFNIANQPSVSVCTVGPREANGIRSGQYLTLFGFGVDLSKIEYDDELKFMQVLRLTVWHAGLRHALHRRSSQDVPDLLRPPSQVTQAVLTRPMLPWTTSLDGPLLRRARWNP